MIKYKIASKPVKNHYKVDHTSTERTRVYSIRSLMCFSFVSEIQHLFYSKENDWGFSTFIPWNVSHVSSSVNNLVFRRSVLRLLWNRLNKKNMQVTLHLYTYR